LHHTISNTPKQLTPFFSSLSAHISESPKMTQDQSHHATTHTPPEPVAEEKSVIPQPSPSAEDSKALVVLESMILLYKLSLCFSLIRYYCVSLIRSFCFMLFIYQLLISFWSYMMILI